MKPNQVIKSGIWYTVSSFLLSGITFLTTPIFTRIMSKAEYGDYANFTSWLSIFSVFISLNVVATLISAMTDYEGKLNKYIFSINLFTMIISVAWILIITVFEKPFESFFGMSYGMIVLMIILSCAQSVINMFQAHQRYEYRYKTSVAISVLLSVGICLLSVLLVISAEENRTMARVIGTLVPNALIAAGLMIFYLLKARGVDFSTWSYVIPICLPYIPHTLSLYVLSASDRVMIKQIRGSEEAAIYSLGVTIGMIIAILVSALNNAYVPWLREQLAKKKYTAINKYSYVYILIFVWLSVGIMIVSPEVLLILGGTEYEAAKSVLAPIEMGCVCQFVYCMYVNIEQIEKKTSQMAMASVLAAVLNVGLNFVCIPMFGYTAAAYTTLVGYMFLVCAHMYLVHKLGYGAIYKNKQIMVALLGMCLLTTVMNYVYYHNLLRIGMFVVYVCVSLGILIWGLKNKVKIMKIIKE